MNFSKGEEGRGRGEDGKILSFQICVSSLLMFSLFAFSFGFDFNLVSGRFLHASVIVWLSWSLCNTIAFVCLNVRVSVCSSASECNYMHCFENAIMITL